MKVRRYFAPSMREALEAVRKEQGVDALILSNRNVEGGIEIMTATGQVDEAVIESMSRRAAKSPVVPDTAATARRNDPLHRHR